MKVMDRGYGFITPDGSDKDLFFHAAELQNAQFNDLNVGDPVEFEEAESDKGPNAVNINVIEGGSAEAAPAEEAPTEEDEGADEEAAA